MNELDRGLVSLQVEILEIERSDRTETRTGVPDQRPNDVVAARVFIPGEVLDDVSCPLRSKVRVAHLILAG